MSLYTINRICHRALHDVAFRAALKSDPDAALAPLSLTDAERMALLTGDVAQLYEWGANAYLLSYLTRWELFGLSVPIYSTRMLAAHDWRDD